LAAADWLVNSGKKIVQITSLARVRHVVILLSLVHVHVWQSNSISMETPSMCVKQTSSRAVYTANFQMTMLALVFSILGILF